MFWGLAMGSSSLVYVIVSLLGKRTEFDMDRMLHRGRYTIEEEITVIEEVPLKGWKILGMGKEFTRGDKIIYVATYTWTLIWTVVFVLGTVYNLSTEVSDASWMTFWKTFIVINIVVSGIVIIWFAIGGVNDLRSMLGRLRTMVRNHRDDGFVVGHRSLSEVEDPPPPVTER
jgi:SSS family solute:Na+ symporter